MSKCEQCDSIIPIIMIWEKPACETFMRCLDVDEFAELTQIWRGIIRHYVSDEVVKSINGCNFLCTLHRQHKLFVTFCDHQTIEFFSVPVVMPYCIKGIEWDRLLHQDVSICWNSWSKFGNGFIRHVDVDKVCTFDLPESQNRLTSFIPWCERYEKCVDSVSSSSGA